MYEQVFDLEEMSLTSLFTVFLFLNSYWIENVFESVFIFCVD